MSKVDIIPPQPMEQNRILTRYLIVILIIPLFLSKIYEILYKFQEGITWTTSDILFDGVIITTYLAMLYFFPRLTPIFENKYILTSEDLKMSRFLKQGDPVKINDISKIEYYKKGEDEDKEEITKILMERIKALTESGFKHEDFTNTSENVIIILSKEKFYQLTPLYPKTFIDKIRKRKPDLVAEQIEMAEHSKRETSL